MSTGFGIAITNLTSKIGILSRKASIRLATETGEKVLARKSELGRILNVEELEQVFVEVLPKRCRPKIITTETEVRECLKRDGMNEEQINAQLNGCKKNYMAAATVFNGTRKCPIFIPVEGESWIPSALQSYSEAMAPATVAHETEHALEKNCRVLDIFRRKVSGVKKFFGKLFDNNYMEKLSNRENAIHDFERDLQSSLQPIVDIVAAKSGIMKMNCEPTVVSISDKLGGEGKLVENLRQIMRENYASGLNKGSEQNKRFKLMRYWMDMERPAYEITGKMEEKIFGLKEGEHAITTGIAKGYEAAKKVAKQERRTYWINKLFGRLKKPNVYLSDKDILGYASSKEEKEILAKMIKDLSVEQKKDFIKVMSSFEGQPNAIKNLNQFIEETTVDGKNFWLNSIHQLEGINTEQLSNPDIVKIAKITDKDGFSLYGNVIKEIAVSKPENIKKFAQIAGENYTQELNVNGMNFTKQNFIYEYLVRFLDNPNFNELKAFCEIKVEGKTPYNDLLFGLSKLPPERIKANLELAQNAAKDGKSVFKEICKEIDEFLTKA